MTTHYATLGQALEDVPDERAVAAIVDLFARWQDRAGRAEAAVRRLTREHECRASDRTCGLADGHDGSCIRVGA